MIRLGTRGSQLAVAQSGHVAAALEAAGGQPVELVIIKTRGDRVTDRPLAEVGGKGLFTKELEVALLEGSVDVAVHSMKDLPTEGPPGLIVGGIPERADPRDVLVGAALGALPAGAIVGTGSARRAVQLHALRPDLEIRGIRGNVDTRIGKQRAGEYAAVVLAAAGMARLGRLGEADDLLDPDAMIPAPGQGALAVQCREGDEAVLSALERIHHPLTAVCVSAERAFLHALSGGCSVPAGCYATLEGEVLRVRAVLGRERGPVRVELTGRREDAVALGQEAARRVRAD